MMFLGDVGGVYGSMMLIGSVLHLLISANEKPTQLLKYYFRVNGEEKKTEKIRINPVNHLEKSKLLHLSPCQALIHNTLLSVFYKCCPGRKLHYIKRIIGKAEDKSNQYLDIRTLMRSHSLLIAHNSAFF